MLFKIKKYHLFVFHFSNIFSFWSFISTFFICLFISRCACWSRVTEQLFSLALPSHLALPRPNQQRCACWSRVTEAFPSLALPSHLALPRPILLREAPHSVQITSFHSKPFSWPFRDRVTNTAPARLCRAKPTTSALRVTEAWPKAFPNEALPSQTLHNDCYAVTRLREQSFALRPKAHTHQHDRSARFLQNLAQRLLSEAFSFASREALRASPMVLLASKPTGRPRTAF